MSLSGGRRLLWRHLRPQRRALWRLAAWSAVEAMPAFLSGVLLAAAIDRGFLAGRPLAGLGWLAALAALWAVGALGTRRVYPWLAATVEPVRDGLVTALVTASLRRAVGRAAGDPGGPGVPDGTAGAGGPDGATVTQATVQVETVRALLSALLRNLRQLLTAGVAALGGLAVLSGPLALVVGGFVVLAVALFTVLLRVLMARYRAVVLREERICALAAPIVQGMRDVVVAAAEGRAAREVGAAIEAEAEAIRAFAWARLWRLPVVTLGAHVPLVALLALSPWLVSRDHLTVGQVVGGVYYLSSGLEPAIQLLVTAGGTIFVSLGVVLGRLAEVCEQPPPAPAPVSALVPEGNDIVVEGVTFAYSAHAQPVIHDLSLTVPDGLHLAVVGPSGVGKSTLANLLAKLATPGRGEIRLGGLALGRIDEHHLRRMVALIPQEAYVFTGTVRENLSYLRPGTTADDLEAAVAAFGLRETLVRLGGLDAELAPGGGDLSPGERQRIALARVYLSPASIVILDEASCHLDAEGEARAEQAFAARPGTLIVIAHRISSALRAEAILVMDGPHPVLGRHHELLRRGGCYAELVGHWHGPPGHG